MQPKNNKKVVALAKKEKTVSIAVALEQTEQKVEAAIATLANFASHDIPMKYAAPVFVKVKEWKKDIDAIEKAVRERVLAVTLAQGETTTEAGTKSMTLDGWVFEARPQRTGLEAGKVEALLRARNLSPEVGMDTQIIYVLNQGKLDKLVKDGVITVEELETCRPELKYAVQTPKKES